MRFWDSSAIVALLLDETHTDRALEHFRTDRRILVSFITALEVSSTLWRKRHAGSAPPSTLAMADASLDRMMKFWTVVDDVDAVMQVARTLITRHPLRTGDAIQLASAAYVAAGNDLPFVTFDTRLGDAARAEGFTVLA